MQSEGVLPFYFGFKDVWTCLAPWNAMAVDLAPVDVCRQVNRGETTFTENYREIAEKYLQLLDYGPDYPFAYNYVTHVRLLPEGRQQCIQSEAMRYLRFYL